MKYFWKDIVFAALALTICYMIGGWSGLMSGAILGILEVSMSFDNAVVNASKLQYMDEKWQKRFLTWGMLIAVFWMRFLVPIFIVSLTAWINPLKVMFMAVYDSKTYSMHLSNSHIQISGFGGAFLFMIFWKFFIDAEKDKHWLAWLEKPLQTLHKFEAPEIILTSIISIGFSLFLSGADQIHFLVAALLGIVANLLVESIGNFLEAPGSTTQVAKAGLAGFLYLESVDASFSFDGVIGAFAISNEVFIIALGLGIGAFAIRSLTLVLVEKGTLSELQYLENAAFWAIGVLSLIMYLKTTHEVPEVVTGLIGAGIIIAGAVHSWLVKDNAKSGNAVV